MNLVDGLQMHNIETKILTVRLIMYHLYLTNHKLQIEKLVAKAFSLAKQMSLQRCCLKITFPAVRSEFRANEMTALP